MSVGVLFGGPAPEHDVSILTGLQALHELDRHGRFPLGIYWSRTDEFVRVAATIEAGVFVNGIPTDSTALELRLGRDGGFFELAGRLGRSRRLDLDALIVATHGGPGEDGSIQAALDLAGVPYSGPTVAGAALGMDKWAFGAVAAAVGLATLPRCLLEASTEALPFGGPYILKPRFGGSSIGIDVVEDIATAKARLRVNGHLESGCVVEPFRADLHDLQIALRTFPTLELSAIERPIRRSSDVEILDYRDKYVAGDGMVSAPRELPAQIPASRAGEIEAAARTLAAAVSVRGVARIDFLANDDELYVNEINTIPGSLSKHLFVDPPVSFITLLDDLLAEAHERPTHRYSSVGADGLVLRSAGSIAGKLA